MDWLVVVVRKNLNSGTSGDNVGPTGAGGNPPSSLVFSFFFNKSLSVMLSRNRAGRDANAWVGRAEC
jgi:hypothetical protein